MIFRSLRQKMQIIELEKTKIVMVFKFFKVSKISLSFQPKLNKNQEIKNKDAFNLHLKIGQDNSMT